MMMSDRILWIQIKELDFRSAMKIVDSLNVVTQIIKSEDLEYIRDLALKRAEEVSNEQ